MRRRGAAAVRALAATRSKDAVQPAPDRLAAADRPCPPRQHEKRRLRGVFGIRIHLRKDLPANPQHHRAVPVNPVPRTPPRHLRPRRLGNRSKRCPSVKPPAVPERKSVSICLRNCMNVLTGMRIGLSRRLRSACSLRRRVQHSRAVRIYFELMPSEVLTAVAAHP